jgi:hypothetical protein
LAKDKDKDDKRTETSGPVVSENDAFTDWLFRLWQKNEPPERIEVWQVFGRNKIEEGEMIFHDDFRPGEKLNIEDVNRVSNNCLEACQNDTDALSARKEMFYKLKVIDKNRKATPLVRRLGPFTCKRARALATRDEHGTDLDDEDTPMDIRSLDLARIKESNEMSRYNFNRYDKNMGEILLFMGGIAADLRQQNSQLFQQNMLLMEKTQELQDRALDRELVRAKEQWKLDMMQDGIRTARNLAPRIFSEMGRSRSERERKKKEAAEANGNGTNGTQKKDVVDAEVKDYGPSPERTLVDNLLTDCEKTNGKDGVKLSVLLFGDWEEVDGGMRCVKEGIFTKKQFWILIGIQSGRLPVTELDKLMPDSGDDDSISMEQLVSAQESGVTQGIITALSELMDMRKEAREENESEE